MTDGTTTFVNASACTVNFLPMNSPIVFDLPNPRTTWLEEARPQTPTANQEKGARRGRWGRRADQIEFCKYSCRQVSAVHAWRIHMGRELSEHWTLPCSLNVMLCVIVSSSITVDKWMSEETLLHVDKWTFLCVLTICSERDAPTSLLAFFTGNKRETEQWHNPASRLQDSSA